MPTGIWGREDGAGGGWGGGGWGGGDVDTTRAMRGGSGWRTKLELIDACLVWANASAWGAAFTGFGDDAHPGLRVRVVCASRLAAGVNGAGVNGAAVGAMGTAVGAKPTKSAVAVAAAPGSRTQVRRTNSGSASSASSGALEIAKPPAGVAA